MHNLNRFHRSAVLLCGLLTVLFTLPHPTPAASAPQEEIYEDNRSEKSIRDLQQEVMTVGKLSAADDIVVDYRPKQTLIQQIKARLDLNYLDKDVRRDGVLIQLMGFHSTRMNIKEVWEKILITNAGVLYDETTQRLLATEDYRTFNLMNSMIILHELRHALQDRHFDLKTLYTPGPFLDDRRLALQAAVEGDAVFVMTQCINFDSGVMSSTSHSDPLISFSPIGNTSQLYLLPPFLQSLFTMPYIHGLHFVAAVHKKKKWKGVNTILQDPPASTAQILHPEKYLKREQPDAITIGYQPENYQLFHSGVLGEFLLNLLLASRDGYTDRAEGWRGDAFQIHVKDSHYFMVWKSTWDKEKSCQRMQVDFKKFLEKTFDLTFKKGNVNGSLFLAGQSPWGYFFLRRVNDSFIFARTNDKNQMNKYIYGGKYD